MEELTSFQEDLMWATTALDDPSGQQILSQLAGEEIYTQINHGRLYPNLDTLVEKGFMRKGAKNRRTNYYTLTTDGKMWLRKRSEWRDEISGTVAIFDFETES